jgi:HAMP domain-containing protein
MEQKYIYDLHHEYKEWLNTLSFYEDDILIMRKRVEEIAAKYTDKEVMAMVEHFQNQLILQQEQLEILRKKVKQGENKLEENIENNPTAVDHRKVDDNGAARDEMQTFEKLFNELRRELIRFLARWM